MFTMFRMPRINGGGPVIHFEEAIQDLYLEQG